MAHSIRETRGSLASALPYGENTSFNTVSVLPTLKRARSPRSYVSECSQGADIFSWRNNGPIRRVKRNVKWAFQLESFPAPDFVKKRPLFGVGAVKGILKRSMSKMEVAVVAKSVEKADATCKFQPLSPLAEPSTNSDVSSQFEEDVCDGEEQDQKPRRTKFKLTMSPHQSPSLC